MSLVVAPSMLINMKNKRCQYSCGGENEEFNWCASTYGDSCQIAIYQNRHCAFQCKPACACKKMYARHPISGKCIPVSDCPKLYNKTI